MKNAEEMRKVFRDFLQQFVNKYYCRIRIDYERLIAISAAVDPDDEYDSIPEETVQLFSSIYDTFTADREAEEEDSLLKTDLLKLAMAICCKTGIGLSAQTIIAYCTGVENTGSREPGDADDVSRCVLLLSYFPEWKKRIKDIDSRFPCWGDIGRHWDEIETACVQKQYKEVNALLDKYRGSTPNVIRIKAYNHE